MKIKLDFFGLAILAILCFSCVSVNTGTGSKRTFIMLSQNQENQMGEKAYAELLKTERVSNNQRLNALLLRVGKRIAAQSPVRMNWEFKLIESPQMNAFCLPGGKVAFYTGILPIVQNEAAMAIVMGHEIAHAVARHGAQRVSQGMIAQFGMTVLDVGLLQDNKYRNAVLAGLGLGTQVGVMLPFSRSHESEADDMGLRYAAAAGYDPSEAPRFWQRFSQASSSGGKSPEFLSTHPADSTRIRKLQDLQTEAQALYLKSKKYGLGERIAL